MNLGTLAFNLPPRRHWLRSKIKPADSKLRSMPKSLRCANDSKMGCRAQSSLALCVYLVKTADTKGRFQTDSTAENIDWIWLIKGWESTRWESRLGWMRRGEADFNFFHNSQHEGIHRVWMHLSSFSRASCQKYKTARKICLTMLNTKNSNFSQFLTIHIQIMKILLFRKSEVWAFFQILFRLPTVAEEQMEADSHFPHHAHPADSILP